MGSPFSQLLFSPSWPPSPRLRLMPKPLPPTTVDTMAVDTDTVDTAVDTDTAVTDTADTVVLTDTVVTITARGLPMPNLKQRLMPKLESPLRRCLWCLSLWSPCLRCLSLCFRRILRSRSRSRSLKLPTRFYPCCRLRYFSNPQSIC